MTEPLETALERFRAYAAAYADEDDAQPFDHIPNGTSTPGYVTFGDLRRVLEFIDLTANVFAPPEDVR
jgi:hypothetical protein